MSTKSLQDLSALDYPVRIEFDHEDSVYVADFVDLPGCSSTGSSVAEAYERAQEAKAEWLRLATTQGLPIPRPSKASEYSGRILLRLPTSLHATLAEKARRDRVSLNQYIVRLLSSGAVGEEVSGKVEALLGHVQSLVCQVATIPGFGRVNEPLGATALSGLHTSRHQPPGSLAGWSRGMNARESARFQ